MSVVPLDASSPRALVHTRLDTRALAGGIGVCVALSLVLAPLTTAGVCDGVDQAVLEWTNAHRTPLASTCAAFVTMLGSRLALALVAGLIAFALWRNEQRLAALELAVACIAAGLLTTALKLGLARPRPSLAAGLLPASGFSFPSGHASGIAALLTVTAVYSMTAARTHRQRVALGVAHAGLGLAVGASRVYLGVHYPSDVIMGFALGIACGLGAHALVHNWPAAVGSPVLAHGAPLDTETALREPYWSGSVSGPAAPSGSAPPSPARTRRGSSPADRS